MAGISYYFIVSQHVFKRASKSAVSYKHMDEHTDTQTKLYNTIKLQENSLKVNRLLYYLFW